MLEEKRKIDLENAEINGIQVQYDREKDEFYYRFDDLFGIQQSIIILAKSMDDLTFDVTEDKLLEINFTSEALKAVVNNFNQVVSDFLCRVESIEEQRDKVFNRMKVEV